MKRILFILTVIFSFGFTRAQSVFTVVYATSSDYFVNVRSQPSSKARILTKLYSAHHGLGNGVFRGVSGKWTKVSVGNTTGWAYSKYVGRQTWFTGKGTHRLVAAAAQTPIYGEDYTGERGKPLFTTVPRGTIIADEYQEDENYYMLVTAHDYLFIRKQDVMVEEM